MILRAEVHNSNTVCKLRIKALRSLGWECNFKTGHMEIPTEQIHIMPKSHWLGMTKNKLYDSFRFQYFPVENEVGLAFTKIKKKGKLYVYQEEIIPNTEERSDMDSNEVVNEKS